jgi:hypothetical protein
MSTTKNQAAVALGKLGKGRKKTGLSPAEIQRRREQGHRIAEISLKRRLARPALVPAKV